MIRKANELPYVVGDVGGMFQCGMRLNIAAGMRVLCLCDCLGARS